MVLISQELYYIPMVPGPEQPEMLEVSPKLLHPTGIIHSRPLLASEAGLAADRSSTSRSPPPLPSRSSGKSPNYPPTQTTPPCKSPFPCLLPLNPVPPTNISGATRCYDQRWPNAETSSMIARADMQDPHHPRCQTRTPLEARLAIRRIEKCGAGGYGCVSQVSPCPTGHDGCLIRPLPSIGC